MRIKKILFISMFSLMCSVNSFTKPLFNENVTKELKETTINLFIETSFEKNYKIRIRNKNIRGITLIYFPQQII